MGITFPGIGTQFTRLWQNANPDPASFSAQDIQVDLSTFDAVYISIKNGTSSIVLVGGNGVDVTMNAYANGQLGTAFTLQVRRFAVYTDRVSFEDARIVNGVSAGVTTDNQWSIPMVIYGVNFGG